MERNRFMQSVGSWLAMPFARWRMSRSLAATCFDTIRANATENLFPLGFARHRRLVGGIPCASMGEHQRIDASRLAGLAIFAWSESCRTRDARRARIARPDLRLVPAHRDRRQRHFLLCDF